MRHSPLRTRLLILGFWAVLGLMESGKVYVGQQLRGLPPGMPQGWTAALVGNMPWWLFWAVLTPVVFALARRFRLDGPRSARAAAAHVVLGTVISLLHLTVVAVVYYYTITRGLPRMTGPAMQVRGIIDAYLVVDFMTYWAVVGGWYALEFGRRIREREMAALQLEARAASLEAQMTEARLSALRMELNPHFLFNSLNAISGLVRRGDDPAAVEMLARLGDLLRLTLERHAAHEIPLGEELEFLQLYLGIERVRFPDRLTVHMDVEPATRAELVPTFILQPLVENAIRHGVAPLPARGAVRVSARVIGESLVLEVADTGAGFGSPQSGPGHGVGLANTRARLAQLHGPRAKLELRNPPGGGGLVVVTLPRRAPVTHGASNVLAVS